MADDGTGQAAPGDNQLTQADGVQRASTTTAPREKVVLVPPPPPPGTIGEPAQFAIAMQLVQQSAGSFERLDPARQQQMLQLVETMDRRAFEYACERLKRDQEERLEKIRDGAASRGHVLRVFLVLAAGGLVAISGITGALIWAGQYQFAQTLLRDGITAFLGLLGGAGLLQIFRGSGPSSPKS
jgi:hypothetical protein